MRSKIKYLLDLIQLGTCKDIILNYNNSDKSYSVIITKHPTANDYDIFTDKEIGEIDWDSYIHPIINIEFFITEEETRDLIIYASYYNKSQFPLHEKQDI